jgi:hypothetical protein
METMHNKKNTIRTSIYSNKKIIASITTVKALGRIKPIDKAV